MHLHQRLIVIGWVYMVVDDYVNISLYYIDLYPYCFPLRLLNEQLQPRSINVANKKRALVNNFNSLCTKESLEKNWNAR